MINTVGEGAPRPPFGDVTRLALDLDALRWTYFVVSGEMYDPDGQLVAIGYSGVNRDGPNPRNNPAFEAQKAVGPIPRGWWHIGLLRDSARTGPCVLDLEPIEHSAFGRTGFQIHGDSIAKPGTASSGCIVLLKSARLAIAQSHIRLLHVR